jgi:hypothetical protein
MPTVDVKMWKGVSEDAAEHLISGITKVFVELGINLPKSITRICCKYTLLGTELGERKPLSLIWTRMLSVE